MKYLQLLSLLALFAFNASAQNVGIGTPTPSDQLHTTGTVRFENYKGTNTRLMQIDSSGRLVVTAAGSVYINNTPQSIPDNGCAGGNGITSLMTVAGQSTAVSSSKISVRINITHPNDGDLRIYLYPPTGGVLVLASANGGSGTNFTNTILTDQALVSINSGSAPYTGQYKPKGGATQCFQAGTPFATFAEIGGGNIIPDGPWNLRVLDNAAGNVGTLNSWSISFSGPESITTADENSYIPKFSAGNLIASSIFQPANSTNIGIGTTNVTAPLSFPTSIGNKIDFYYTNSSSRYGIGLQGSLLQMYSDGANSDIAFGYGSSAAFTERMRIKGNGNVGIKITSPDATLHVTRGTATGGTAQFDGTNNSSHFNYFTTEDTYIRGGKAGSKVIINDIISAGDVLISQNGGNVGIGAGVPDANALLHINVGASTTKGMLVAGTYIAYNGASSIPDFGAGSRMMYYPGRAAFRAGYVDGTQWNNSNVGNFSVAMGYNTTASGSNSTAIGQNTNAIGSASTALGDGSISQGTSSTAIGVGATANGAYSTAMGIGATSYGETSLALGSRTYAAGESSTAIGHYTKAKGYASTVLGLWNDSLLINNEVYPGNETTPIFIIGNGDAYNALSNAMVVQKNGNVGIGNSLPDANAMLHVNIGSSTAKGLLVTGTYNGASTVPDLAGGSRLMFYPGKAAFRAGYVAGTQWNNLNVGNYSTAMGNNTIARGSTSTALGYSSVANGSNSTAMGSYTVAGGNNSTSMGLFTTASGLYSTAMGVNTKAAGQSSTSMGDYTIAKGYASTVIGVFNDSVLLNNETFVSGPTPLFIIGNGNDGLNRSNAMVVQKNGNVGIGVSAPMSALHVKGSANFFSGSNTRTGNVYLGTSSANAIELVTSADNPVPPSVTDAYVSIQRSVGAGLHISKPFTFANPGLIGFFVNGSAVGSITTGGATTAYNTTSDKRLKENISSTHYGLSTLMKMNVTDYNFISDNKKVLQTGMLAQELYTVYPQAVMVGGADAATNPWMVDYSKLTPVVVKAVQELSAENTLLKQDLINLKNEIEQIKLLLKKQNP